MEGPQRGRRKEEKSSPIPSRPFSCTVKCYFWFWLILLETMAKADSLGRPTAYRRAVSGNREQGNSGAVVQQRIISLPVAEEDTILPLGCEDLGQLYQSWQAF